MRYAIISGVQGNVVALNAVLDAIAQEDRIDHILCTGDVVGLGPQPNEVIDLLRSVKAEVVKGNYDDAVAFSRLSSGVDFADPESERVDRMAVEWTRRRLTRDHMDYLRQLPYDMRFLQLGNQAEIKRNENQELKDFRKTFITRFMVGSLGERRAKPKPRAILMTHGSPRALNEPIYPDTARSILEVIAERARADVVVTGHGDVSFVREMGGTTFVGVAGISGPRVRPGEAGYMLLENRGELTADWVPVAYDATDHLNAIAQSGLPPALAARFNLTSL